MKRKGKGRLEEIRWTQVAVDHHACTSHHHKGIDGLVRDLDIVLLEFMDHSCLISDSYLISLLGS